MLTRPAADSVEEAMFESITPVIGGNPGKIEEPEDDDGSGAVSGGRDGTRLE